MQRLLSLSLSRGIATLRCRGGAVVAQVRTVIPGHIPTESSGGSQQGWEMNRGHHLHSSVGLHSPIKTACGRDFNPQLYYEVLQACCDMQWMNAIQRELLSDQEYMAYLRENGGAAKDLRALSDSSQHDDDFMVKLKERLRTDKKVSLALCAVQESYERIRAKRDRHETQVAADGGRDPYASMKGRQQGQFGANQPKMP